MALKSVRNLFVASMMAAIGAVAHSQPATDREGVSVRALILPNGETVLSSPVSGTIVGLRAALGRPFRQGDLLVELLCDEPRARARIASAELAAATEEHEAKLRMQGLEQASDVEVALAASAVAKTKAQLELIQFQISQCSIRAPWSGSTSKLHVRNNMTVTPGQPLLDLVRHGVLQLKLNVPSRLTSSLRVGHRFEITVDETGKVYPAQVQRINSRIDPVSQTIELEAAMLSVHPDLLPGMSGVALFKGMR